MMTYTCLFTVEMYMGEEDPRHVEHGIVYADSFAEAMKKVEDIYSSDAFSIKIEMFNTNCLYFGEEHYNTIRHILEEDE